MLRIALRVRLRLRSAQDDTEGEKSEILKEQSLRHGKPCHLPLHKGGGELSLLQTSYNVRFIKRLLLEEKLLRSR